MPDLDSNIVNLLAEQVEALQENVESRESNSKEEISDLRNSAVELRDKIEHYSTLVKVAWDSIDCMLETPWLIFQCFPGLRRQLQVSFLDAEDVMACLLEYYDKVSHVIDNLDKLEQEA